MRDNKGYKISRAVEKYRGRVDPRSGDCGNIASALMEFFDNATLISVSSRDKEHNSVHFCVEIDGKLYDGYGQTSAEEMVREFGEVDSLDSVDPQDFLHKVDSVQKEDYLLFPTIRDRVLENLEEEFSE